MDLTKTEKNDGMPDGAGTDPAPEAAGTRTAAPAEDTGAAGPEAAAHEDGGPGAGNGAEAEAEDGTEDGTDDQGEDQGDGETEGETEEEAPVSSGVLSAAAAVVAAGLAVVGLSGSWVGRIAAERQTLLGQIETAQGGSAATQISAIYGDAWHTTALVNGIFALIALIVGIAVLTRPGKPGWVRACATGGAVLGGIGVFLATGMYFDLFLALPEAGS
ncbi:hypothetical protein [Streptomyces clavuligerus]|uniref:Integral membrane protein n=1 Tax=Streptomyces clavuligerus TaxID=1901 RepID=E2Q7W9_STRCL|nr:hypothetical protein [Streptomyces clavuligerus]ANW21835.1 hypothetical protein BB341_06745 [Streptomyces clavuligerus]AXU12492.1 hypothetical protein D1794_07000 [Streptomyces clavuligerus]EFG09501.1 integral membrane protein [Streptomyces clavuligerus]MBY6302388.1 hypothetical protein [Streptomyces clavuligerus]QCS05274.1 hypothetical protein CRV15_06420 [Streptomyces clavuligerus]